MALNTQARIGGSGALLQLGATTVTSLTTTDVAATNFTTIAQINNLSPSMECAEVDVTSLNSGINREFIPGHLSATLTFQGNLVQSNATTNVDLVNTTSGLLTVYQGRQVRAWRIVLPVAPTTAGGTNVDQTAGWGIVGFLTNLSVSADNGDNAMTIDGTIRISDSVIVDAAVA